MRAAFLLLCLAACSSQVEVGYNSPVGGGGAGGAALTDSGAGNVLELAGSGGGAGASSAAPVCEQLPCRGKIYKCGDCEDNDEDGLIDALDPECLGPCDDSEDSFAREGPGFTPSCRLDCYFDRNAGGGNVCLWNRQCDPEAEGASVCPYDPEAKASGRSCAVLEAEHPGCAESCLPLTPNGCDCFGCCELPGGRTIFLGTLEGASSPCSSEDPDACEPCTQVTSCVNPCEACEVCVGKPLPEVGCAGAGPECPWGAPRCGSIADCGSNAYCITGCCVDVPR